MCKKTYTLIFILLFTFGCDLQSEFTPTPAVTSEISDEKRKQQQARIKTNVDLAQIKRTKARTWQEIKKSGYIIALKLVRETVDALPRSGSTSTYHLELFKAFAKGEDLTVKWLHVDTLDDMFDELSQFNADIIPRHLTITEQRKKLFGFTYPLLRDKEVLLGHPKAKKPEQGAHITVHLPKNSAYIDSITKDYPSWTIAYLDKALNSEELADALNEGTYQYTVIDGFALDVLKQYREDVNDLLTLPHSINLAWAINIGLAQFQQKLNEFISVHHALATREPNRTIDFDKVRKKGLPLRVITRNSPGSYFLWRSKLMGFEYELMKHFTTMYPVKLEMIVADSYEEMLEMLKDGRGDLIAAGLSRTTTRAAQIEQAGLQNTIRYNRVNEQLVAHRDSSHIKTLSDLKGRTITVRKSSSFWETAKKIEESHGVYVSAANESLTTEQLVAMVDNKEIDLTIGDDNFLNIEKSFRDNIVTPLNIKESVPYAYILRKNNPKLLTHLNQFIRKTYRTTFYNVVKNRYFHNRQREKDFKEASLSTTDKLSPYDDIVKESVIDYHFDWRLIVSQMYQESRFNPKASNPSGASGLMQMLPRTAKELGVTNLHEPQQAIISGVKYLDWTRNRFSKNLPVQEQIFFSLASYNAGFGHVKDAQRLAKQIGLRDDRWFNNVETAMLLLQQRRYYKNARYGYVRGREPVNYVRDIHQRYLSYIRITSL
jgi:membrane-bound lytic murein transglycosylase F